LVNDRRAIALAQAMVAELEKSQPNRRDYAGAPNSLARLHGEVGRDAEAEPILQAPSRSWRKPAASTARTA
jgi:hypothetical protein